MAKKTIKSLEQEVKELRENNTYWRDQSKANEAEIKRINNEKSKDVELDRSFAKQNDNLWQGRYEGFSEATGMFLKTDAEAKYEIDQRLEFERKNPLYNRNQF